MGEPDSTWDAYLARQRSAVEESRALREQWRRGVMARMDEFEAADRRAEPDAGEGEDPPEGAPSAYARVRARVERGELDWVDVAAGDSEDRDVRAVHVWLAARLDAVARGFSAVEPGCADEQAQAAVVAAVAGGTAR